MIKLFEKKNWKLCLFGTFFLCLFFLASNCQALTVSPPVKEFSGDPGSRVQGIVKVYNETNEAVSVSPLITSFSAKESGNGEPEFSSFSETVTPEGLPNWIKIPQDSFTVKPLDWQNIIFEINIPDDAEPGGHYAAVFFSPQAKETDSGKVSVDYKTGILILLSVSGEISQEGKMESFFLKNSRFFYDHVPVFFELKIRNSGNVHFRPAGGVVISNMLGGKIEEFPIVKTENSGNVLPGSVRRYDLSWGNFKEDDLPKNFWEKVKFEWKNFRIGKYSAATTVGFPSGLSENGRVEFWVIPWQLILIALLILIVLITVFRWYNRWIIGQARKEK